MARRSRSARDSSQFRSISIVPRSRTLAKWRIVCSLSISPEKVSVRVGGGGFTTPVPSPNLATKMSPQIVGSEEARVIWKAPCVVGRSKEREARAGRTAQEGRENQAGAVGGQFGEEELKAAGEHGVVGTGRDRELRRFGRAGADPKATRRRQGSQSGACGRAARTRANRGSSASGAMRGSWSSQTMRSQRWAMPRSSQSRAASRSPSPTWTTATAYSGT